MESKKKAQEQAVITDPLEGLDKQEKLWVVEYSRHFNKSRATINAGYNSKNPSSMGWEISRRPNVAKAIGLFMEQHVMQAGEALSRMSSFASSSMGTFVTPEGVIDINSEEAKENMHLVKKFRRKVEKRIDPVTETPIETETTEIELYDAKDAVDKILQLHGKYKNLIGKIGEEEDQDVFKLAEGIYIKF